MIQKAPVYFLQASWKQSIDAIKYLTVYKAVQRVELIKIIRCYSECSISKPMRAVDYKFEVYFDCKYEHIFLFDTEKFAAIQRDFIYITQSSSAWPAICLRCHTQWASAVQVGNIWALATGTCISSRWTICLVVSLVSSACLFTPARALSTMTLPCILQHEHDFYFRAQYCHSGYALELSSSILRAPYFLSVCAILVFCKQKICTVNFLVPFWDITKF